MQAPAYTILYTHKHTQYVTPENCTNGAMFYSSLTLFSVRSSVKKTLLGLATSQPAGRNQSLRKQMRNLMLSTNPRLSCVIRTVHNGWVYVWRDQEESRILISGVLYNAIREDSNVPSTGHAGSLGDGKFHHTL